MLSNQTIVSDSVVASEQRPESLLQWCRQQLHPLGSRIDVSSLLEVLAPLNDSVTICEIVHDTLGSHLNLINPQQFLSNYLVRRHKEKGLPGEPMIPAPPLNSAYARSSKQSSGPNSSEKMDFDNGFVQVISRKKKNATKAASRPIGAAVGVDGRPVVGATFINKEK